jgi:L-threonylcarbamoyladenylate synthase
MAQNNPFSFAVPVLKAGGVGILPTDTIYGIVGSAARPKTVQKIYKLRKRNPKKPMIILIGDIRDLKRFGVRLDTWTKSILKKLWPGKVSVVFPTKKFRYLNRGTGTLAFRMPKPKWLNQLLRATGPLVAPSANFEGKDPARTVAEAKRYFGDKVQFYIDIGRLVSKPSTLVAIERGTLKVLRKGAVRLV